MSDEKFSKAKGARCWECVFATAPFVPTQNPVPRSRLAICGEAPGAYEAARGIPFTGPSGRLLDQVLEHHGYARSEVMVTNVCLCRPTDNADPPKSAVAACKPRLDYELAQSGVEKILAVGGTAASNLIDPKKKISTLRIGPPKPYIENPQVQVVATWHPAYCVSPNTRILTSELEWVEASNISKDDILIGFEEHIDHIKYGKRQLKPSLVLSVGNHELESYKITLQDGTSVVSSAEHMWLVYLRKSYSTKPEWIETKDLTTDYDIISYMNPWTQLHTYEAGYIAGILDGEGWIGHSQAAWAQVEGTVADTMLNYVVNHGFSITKSNVSDSPNVKRFHFKGKADSILALGMFRPKRLIENSTLLWNGKLAGRGRKPIVKIENVGLQNVVSINTTSKTFIAEGLLSHNCLRAPDAFPSFVSDTGKLRKGKYSEVAWQPPIYHVVDDKETTLEAIRRLWSVWGPLVIDIETGIDKDDQFEHADQHDLLCIGISYAPGRVIVIGTNALRDPEVQENLGALLASKRVVGHNIKSDLEGLHPIFGKIEAAGDTMLQSYCQDERPGLHALEKLGVEVLGTPAWKTQFKSKHVPKSGNYADAPRWALYEYNAKDVHVTRTLWDLNNERMNEREHQQHAFLIQAANAIVNLEMAGITFDAEYSEELQKKLEEELFELELQIERTTGRALNPRSPMQIQRWFADQGFMLKNTTADTLAAVLTRATIPEIIRKFIEELLLHRRRTKLNGTYVKGFQKRIHDGKVYTTYTLHGTTSGRLASKNPNMQNVVRDKRIKNQFTVEDEDNVLIQLDYKQAEGRVITTLARDEYLASIFRDPSRDIFDELTTQIYGENNWGKEERVKVKTFFYGLSYGRGAESIGVEFKMPLQEAKELLANFKALIPATVSWQASVTHRVLSGEDLITPFGRKRSFWLITEQNKADVLNEALSFLPQSIASDICLSSLIELQEELRGLATTRLTIHDAMIFECKREDADYVTRLATRSMVNAGKRFTDYVPFVVDVSMGKRWSEL